MKEVSELCLFDLKTEASSSSDFCKAWNLEVLARNTELSMTISFESLNFGNCGNISARSPVASSTNMFFFF